MTLATPLHIPGERVVTSGARYRTDDGGAGQGVADLWCTYAAVRALRWLLAVPADVPAWAAYLLDCQNADGGFGWQKGVRSDVWATYYCTQALRDLGRDIPRRRELRLWIGALATAEGGFGMTPGQAADLWATYYAVRTLRDVFGEPPTDVEALGRWLAVRQQAGGGIAWHPGSAHVDTRAAYYALCAWATAVDRSSSPPGIDAAALRAWLLSRQLADGGFTFGEQETDACLWATFRATRALAVLGVAPRDRARCASWIEARRQPGGAFARWPRYPVADVWACFSTVGALDTLGTPLAAGARDQVIAFLRGCQLADSGFTYREPAAAGDVLATAALCMLGARACETVPDEAQPGITSLVAWLHRAHLPYEGGVMYMPARGAEVRSTLWALAALNAAQAPPLSADRIADWLRRLQNPDGGFGFWSGRGSDVTATASAVECLAYLPDAHRLAIDRAGARAFLERCHHPDGLRFTPGGEAALAVTCQGLRTALLLGAHSLAEPLAAHIPRHASRLGGYAARPAAVPDLVSTYQAVLTLDVLGRPWSPTDVVRFVDRLRRPTGGYGWSPLSPTDGGPLALCLAELLRAAAVAHGRSAHAGLPRLNL